MTSQKIPRICITCGKEFSVNPSDIRQGQGKHCSRACRSTSVPRSCPSCGTQFYVRPAIIARGHGKCCSIACRNQHKNQIVEGRRFGRLVVLREAGRNSNQQILWECQCDCGTSHEVPTSSLLSGATKSCGCLWRASITKHSKSNSKIYNVWARMIQRCSNPRNSAYPNYGGRGITVIPEWLDFSTFYKDMGDPPPNMTLDRINNDLDYSKENCKWSTHQQQQQNTRYNIVVTHGGKTQCLIAWARDLGIHPSTVYNRMVRGKTALQALELEQTRSKFATKTDP